MLCDYHDYHREEMFNDKMQLLKATYVYFGSHSISTSNAQANKAHNRKQVGLSTTSPHSVTSERVQRALYITII